MGEIHRRHFVDTARGCGLGSEFDAVIDDIVARAPSVVAYVGARLPVGFPARVFETITQGLLGSAARL
jgi:serine/threonine-protein kinase HipA